MQSMTKRKTPEQLAEPKNKGRESTYSDETANMIIERVSAGVPLAQVCRDIGLGLTTWYDWCKARVDLAERIAHAREAGFDMIAVDTMQIVDTPPERTLTEQGDKVDAGHVAWLKNRAEQRLKLLAKWDPKRYGDKLAIGGAADLPPVQSNVTLDPSDAYKAILGGKA